VHDHLLRVLALKLDASLLEGSGTPPEIRGLKNISGVQTLAAGANGTTPTLDTIADAIALLEAVNVPTERIGWSRTRGTSHAWRKLKASTGGGYLWERTRRPRRLDDLRRSRLQHAQLGTTETQGSSCADELDYVFDTNSLVYVQRSPIEIELDRSQVVQQRSERTTREAARRSDRPDPDRHRAHHRRPGLKETINGEEEH
jgi:hypothetical protein